MPKLIKPINKKVVVFDLDETLGYFEQFGRFCNLVDKYYKNSNKSYSIFNDLMDLYPEFSRPNINNILKYLLQKKKENKCQSLMIYTNNTGEKKWAEHIKSYYEYKLNSKLFEQIICAFKVNGKIVEVNRTTHDKCIDDFFRCTKLSCDIEICFIDDLHHPKMVHDNVYYIHVKEYKHDLPANEMLNRFLNSPLSSDIKNKDDFKEFSLFNLKYNIIEKNKQEQEIDIIIGKKMLEHIREFFDKDEPKIDDTKTKSTGMLYPNANPYAKSFKKNKGNKTNYNRTVKKKS